VNHDHVVRRDAQVVGHDLGKRRLVPLPVRARSRDRRHPARPLDLDAAALPAECAGLDIGRQPDPDDLPARSTPGLLAPQPRVVRRGERALEGQVVVARVVDLPRRRPEGEALGRDEVAPADFGGIEPERARGCVHQPLDDEAGLGPARAAVGGDRRRRGQRAGDSNVAGRHDIAAGQETRVVPRRAAGGVHQHRAERRGDTRAQRGDTSLGVHGQLALADRAARVIRGDLILAPRSHPLDGPAEPPRQPAQQHLLAVGP
jgi:hypothetical protein